MPIFPLPQFEADLAEYRLEKEAYEKLSVPKTVVVRFGSMKMVGEFPFSLNVKPGCGTKMVARTHRGTELAEMLTSTCPNAGCSKSVTRKEMLEYIENSGGKDYPYFNDGSIIRIATTDDLNEQRRIEGLRQGMQRFAQAKAQELGLAMKVIEAEPILGGERLTFFYTAEDRVDFRELVTILSHEYPARIEMRQVGARDEARLIADYEKCGQHCCCKQFLKVLKPISMKSAKIQKATLDPLKISGRCGRLMCCLRYEDETYDTLRKRLPKMKARVTTPEGIGTVVDAQILTQLVLVVLDEGDKRIAVPVENITLGAPPYVPPELRPQPCGPAARGGPGHDTASRDRRPPAPPRGAPQQQQQPRPPAEEDPLRGMSEQDIARKTGTVPRDDRQGDYRERSQREGDQRNDNRPPQPPQGREPRRDDRRDQRDQRDQRDNRNDRNDPRRQDRSQPRDRNDNNQGQRQGQRPQSPNPDQRQQRGPAADAPRQGPPRPPAPQRDAAPPQSIGPAPQREDDDLEDDFEGPDDSAPNTTDGSPTNQQGQPNNNAPRNEGGNRRRRRRRRRGGGGGGGPASGPPNQGPPPSA